MLREVIQRIYNLLNTIIHTSPYRHKKISHYLYEVQVNFVSMQPMQLAIVFNSLDGFVLLVLNTIVSIERTKISIELLEKIVRVMNRIREVKGLFEEEGVELGKKMKKMIMSEGKKDIILMKQPMKGREEIIILIRKSRKKDLIN